MYNKPKYKIIKEERRGLIHFLMIATVLAHIFFCIFGTYAVYGTFNIASIRSYEHIGEAATWLFNICYYIVLFFCGTSSVLMIFDRQGW